MAVSFRVTVPGGAQVPAAGVTSVGVQPTHRRRGINSSLMRAQLDDIHARGESIAVLYASEGGIYGRFGYGLASFLGEIDLEGDRSAFIRGYRAAGRVRLLPRAEAMPSMRQVYERAQPRRPGMIAMDDAWWEWLLFEDEKEKDDPMFYAVHDTDGVADAYATYRVKHEWPDSIPTLELTVRQLVASDPRAYADIWRYLFDIDLVHRVKAWNRPVDEPLFFLMQEPRRLRFRTSDALRVRLVDVPVALEARGYVGDGRIVVDVEDRFCPWNEGRYALEVTTGGATCERTTEEPGYRLQRSRSGRDLSGWHLVPSAPSSRARGRAASRRARSRRRAVRVGPGAVELVHLLVRDGLGAQPPRIPCTTNTTPMAARPTESATRIHRSPRSPTNVRPPLPNSVNVKSETDTPIVMNSAAATAASRPPSAVASAMTAEAVVAKKIQAPGFKITDTTPRIVGPMVARRLGRGGLRVARLSADPPELVQRQEDQEPAADHPERAEQPLAGRERREPERERHHHQEQRAVRAEHHPQPAGEARASRSR